MISKDIIKPQNELNKLDKVTHKKLKVRQVLKLQ